VQNRKCNQATVKEHEGEGWQRGSDPRISQKSADHPPSPLQRANG
jgi:hypothetical protein